MSRRIPLTLVSLVLATGCRMLVLPVLGSSDRAVWVDVDLTNHRPEVAREECGDGAARVTATLPLRLPPMRQPDDEATCWAAVLAMAARAGGGDCDLNCYTRFLGTRAIDPDEFLASGFPVTRTTEPRVAIVPVRIRSTATRLATTVRSGTAVALLVRDGPDLQHAVAVDQVTTVFTGGVERLVSVSGIDPRTGERLATDEGEGWPCEALAEMGAEPIGLFLETAMRATAHR